MFKKSILVAGSILVAASFSHVHTAQAEKRQIVATQETEIKDVFLNIFSDLFLGLENPAIGSISFDKDKNVITAKDVAVKLSGNNSVYKKVEIVGYKVDSKTGDYSIDLVTLNDAVFKLAQPKIEKTENSPKVPAAPIPKSVIIQETRYEGIRSEAKKSLYIQKSTIKGFSMDFPGIPDLSSISGVVSGITYKNLDELKKAAIKFTEFSTLAPIPGQPLPKEFFETTASVYSNISWEKLSIKGFPTFPTPTGGSLTLGEISSGKLDKGILQDITIKGLGITDPSNPEITETKIGSMSVYGIDFINLMKLSATMQGQQQPSPEQISALFQLIKGYSLKDVIVSGPDREVAASAVLGWDKFVGLFPTMINLKGDMSVVLPSVSNAPISGPLQDYAMFMQMAGLDKLVLKTDFGIHWDEASNKVTIKPFFYDAEKLVELNFSASIGNITRELLEERDPNKISILALGATAGTVTLKITDKGAQKLIDEQNKALWTVISTDLAAEPGLRKVVEHITQMINEPKGTLKITLKPKGEMTMAQLSASMILGPKALPTLFDIESSFEK